MTALEPCLGCAPASQDSAVATAHRFLTEAPTMIPIYAHRFLPAGRGTSGHPVLSMWGTDIIYYGSDLVDYINQEFEEPRPERPADWSPRAMVPFWRDYL